MSAPWRPAVLPESAPWEAVPVLHADAPRGDWLEARRLGIGGSDASVVAGANPYRSRWELYRDKVGEGAETPDNDAMRWGRLLEPAMRQAFTEDTGLAVELCGLLAHQDRPWQLHTPDGITADGGLYEAKTVGAWAAEQWEDGQVADHAELQVQHGMAVTGLTHAWVVALVGGRDWRIRLVQRDEDLIRTLTTLEDTFWRDHVLTRTPPELDAASLPAVREAYPEADPGTVLDGDETALAAVEAVRAARAEAREADRVKAGAEATLLAMLADKEALSVHGAVVATARNTSRTTLDTRRLRADHPDLAAPYLTTTSSRTLRLK